MITIIGLGPGSLDRVPGPVRSLLLDTTTTIVVRTRHHPAAAELADLRDVIFCDDLYEADTFADVYDAIAERVGAVDGPVIYAVPGSALVGEFAVRRILSASPDATVIPGESFVDAMLAIVSYDPLDRGLQILNGHELPDPLILDKPTIIGHLDSEETFGDVLDAVSRVVPEGAVVTVAAGAGSSDAEVVIGPIPDVDTAMAGLRTSLFIDVEPGGMVGAVHVMRRLRDECPWDRDQTHQTLLKNLVEETYELIDAIEKLDGEDDWVGYAAVEDELGDVLLQVLFHEAIARERGAFDIDGVAEVLRQKLVRRHPHVFGDVEVSDADEVKRNWDRIKTEENGGEPDSALDGIPSGMPAVQRASKLQNRAAKIGFDWDEASQVLPKLGEEIEELSGAMSGDGDVEAELGDLLFTVINLSRHLGVDPELALARANTTFETRFRRMEAEGPLDGLDLAALEERWERAKRSI